MKLQLSVTALPVCPFVVAAQHVRAAADGENGIDGALPGVPVT